jgi:hypothetical protein
MPKLNFNQKGFKFYRDHDNTCIIVVHKPTNQTAWYNLKDFKPEESLKYFNWLAHVDSGSSDPTEPWLRCVQVFPTFSTKG